MQAAITFMALEWNVAPETLGAMSFDTWWNANGSGYPHVFSVLRPADSMYGSTTADHEAITPIYTYKTSSMSSLQNLEAYFGGSYINIRDDSCSSNIEFRNKVKGMVLVYKKGYRPF